ncbi:WhiB family transcriptional regulator [Saccharopolyspora sp. MS10]|uniref:WhiB family transcriptional regulator n=1 Tax=Saccharopolyspora sp. MS10 TaxID=3385973 RepID=UPI0039A206BE
MLTISVPSQPGQGVAGDGAVGALLDAATGGPEEVPCRTDPDLWFAESPGDLERAKALCGRCPLRARCLEGALSRGEPWGVWGGEIFERGAVVARKRPRGRPRKQPAPAGPATVVAATTANTPEPRKEQAA